MHEIMTGKATAAQIGAYLVSLQIQPIPAQVLISSASALRALSRRKFHFPSLSLIIIFCFFFLLIFVFFLPLTFQRLRLLAAFSFSSQACPYPRSEGALLLDIVGTGGDSFDTFNASTAASVILAACGVPCAKHGNRSSSGKYV